MFPRDRVLASLAKYDIAFDESMDDEALRARLAEFYAQRTLLKQAVTPAKVADALYLLASDRLSQTTGQVISVDAGLADAFLR
jgi:enoyl-[acyl-carrier-protein] reductase (NADH)